MMPTDQPLPDLGAPRRAADGPDNRHPGGRSGEPVHSRRQQLIGSVVVSLCVILALASGAGGITRVAHPLQIEAAWSPLAARLLGDGSAIANDYQSAQDALDEAEQADSEARKRLTDTIAAAGQLHSSSEGKVLDDGTRQALSQEVTESTSCIESSQGLPLSDEPTADDLRSEARGLADSTDTLVACQTDLEAAMASVNASQTEWQAAEDAKHASYTGENGRLNPATLCPVPYDTKQLFTCPGVEAWMRLNEAYKAVFGEDIPIDLSYRTYDEQVEMKAIYGSGAAAPGTSNHGWATAVDLPDWREGGIGLEWDYGMPKYEWMKANAPAYNWINPGWAQEGGSNPEPWHFEFVG